MRGSKTVRKRPSVLKTVGFALLWIVACIVILVFLARRRPDLVEKAEETLTEQFPQAMESAHQMLESAQNMPILSNLLHRFDTDQNPVEKTVHELYLRANDSLAWITSSASDRLLRWDMVANADIHILHNLVKYLKHIKDFYPEKGELQRLVENGLQCTPLQAAQQELIAQYISMDICSEVEWYKLVQLAAPEMSNFLDVGANKGYLGSLFLALWGGGKMAISPAKLFALSTKLGTWKNSRNPAGYCKDGFNFAIPAHCAEGRDGQGKCLEDRTTQIKVNSFDGSSYLASTITSMLREHIARENPLFSKEETSPWIYQHNAVADRPGRVRFTKQNLTTNAGFEGGSIKPSGSAETEEVNMITIDLFLQKIGIKHVDILKIDTEGHDNKVILGAVNALSNQSISMFTFEGGKGVSLSKQMLVEFDQWGFSCYSTSRAGLFKWSGGCMKEKYMGSFNSKDKGNVFCVNRKQIPMVTLAYDLLTFPALIQLFSQHPPPMGMSEQLRTILQLNKEQKEGKELTLSKLGNPAVLTPLYVNVKKFCKPFPQCAKVV